MNDCDIMYDQDNVPQILEINPNFTIADKSLSLIQKYKPGDTHLKSMEKKLQNNIDDEAMRRLNFALGKAYEDIGDFKKSFKSRSRLKCAPPAPACGLYLTKINY